MYFYNFPLLSILLLLYLSGCVSQPKVDTTLPTINQVKFVTDIDSVAFEWSSLASEPRVAGYYLYRKSNTKDYELIATIPSRFATHYVDSSLQQNTNYLYRIATFSEQGAVSVASEPISITTSVFAALSQAQALSNYPKKVKLLWQPHSDLRVQGYIIQRAEGRDFVEIARVNNRLIVEYIDTHLEDGEEYVYRILAITANGTQSMPSQILKAKTKPAPSITQGVFASFDLPRQVQISWQANPEKDIVQYQIFRSALGDLLKEKIGEVPANMLTFTDKSEIDGVRYGYYVIAVDRDSLLSPSQKEPTIGGTLAAPKPPIIESIQLENGKVALRWKAGDSRSVQYTINKQEDSLFANKKERYISVPYTYFFDADVIPGEKYLYNVIAIDRHGLNSTPSQSASISVP